MQYQNLSAKAKAAEAERVIVSWVSARNWSYADLGYPHQSPEQALMPSTGGALYEETPIELRCNRVMAELRKSEHELFRMAIFEYRDKDYWIAKCRSNQGWLDSDNTFMPVDIPRTSDFMRYMESVYGISKGSYYHRLRTLKKRIADHVL